MEPEDAEQLEAPAPAEAPAGPDAAAPAAPAPPAPTAAAAVPEAIPSADVASGTKFHKEEGADVRSGPVSNPLLLKHERLTGTISKITPGSGGMVRSHAFEGELVFRTEGIMPECQSYQFRENEQIEFDVQSDERGRPQAAMMKPVVSRKPTECLGQRHRGYVRRFADRWGFLNAAAFDGDLFVHRDNLLMGMHDHGQDGQPQLRNGQAVEFDVALDDRGRVVAKQITTSSLLRPTDWLGRRLQGFVRSFQGAWGFINCEKFAGDLFVHRDSLVPQCQGMELASGMLVEFDVEKDNHKKGGRNRLVARQVAVLQGQPAQATARAQTQPGADPYGYGAHLGMPPYGSTMNPAAPTFSPQPSMYYPQVGYGQPPYPYADPVLAQAQYPQPPIPGALPPQQPLMPPMQQPVPPYGHQMVMPGQPQFGQAPMAQPPMPQVPQPQYGVPPAAQPPYGQVPMPGYGQLPGMPGAASAVPAAAAAAMPQQPVVPMQAAGQPAIPGAAQPDAAAQSGEVPSTPGEQPQVLLHITTHDWEPDQSGQLRVRKGTLVNVSHRAAHGWVYAATVKIGENNDPPSEGWVPQAVAKRVSLASAESDWASEGPETLGLVKGDFIAVSKEAERGWVFGERVSPRRDGCATDGWLPKKILKYVLM